MDLCVCANTCCTIYTIQYILYRVGFFHAFVTSLYFNAFVQLFSLSLYYFAQWQNAAKKTGKSSQVKGKNEKKRKKKEATFVCVCECIDQKFQGQQKTVHRNCDICTLQIKLFHCSSSAADLPPSAATRMQTTAAKPNSNNNSSETISCCCCAKINLTAREADREREGERGRDRSRESAGFSLLHLSIHC